MVSMIKTQKVANRVYQYQTDALEAAGANAQVEGADPTMATLTPHHVMISGTPKFNFPKGSTPRHFPSQCHR